MPRTSRFALTLGEWKLVFDGRDSSLHCQHRPTSASLAGRLRFESSRGEEMPIARNDGAGPGQLAIRDARGDCQVYVRLSSAGHDLTIALVPRGRTTGGGRLTYQGIAALGDRTFACRTFAPQDLRVVQMAAGPADSALNDSLFDIDLDAAMRFRAAQVSLRTGGRAKDGKGSFTFAVEARTEHPAALGIAISVERDFYRSRYVPWYRPLDKGRLPTPPTGWMSWNTYFDQAGEEENLAEARLGRKYLQPYGLQIWSIESWQDNSPSLPVSQFHNLTLRPYAKQFPHGMQWLARQIRRLGFTPGLWTVPFGTGDEEFYRRHKRWFLHHPDGRPMSNWSGTYVLDPSQPAVRRHMTETHRTMAGWGYDFFKIDGMSGTGRGYSAHFYEAPEVRAAFRRPCENPFELCVQSLRRGVGPQRTVLACGGHYTGPEVPHCDAARIGGDVVSPNCAPEWRNYLRQVSVILACLHVHDIVWYCDPDTLLVGTYAPLETARLAATAVALAGQVTFAGDKLGELPPERMRLLQRCLPVCEVRPLDLYPINHLLPIWDLKISRPFGQWDVVSVFNFNAASDAELSVDIAELGLNVEKQYLVYDFWAGKLLGRFSCRIPLEVKHQSNRLLAVHEDLGRPQFLSTDRHLTQGGVSLRDLVWDEQRLVLSGKTELVAGEQTRLTFAVPVGFELQTARATRAEVSGVEASDDGSVTVTLRGARSTTAAWRLPFAARGRQRAARRGGGSPRAQ